MTQDPDYHIGATRELGSYLFTPEAIVEFAKKFDPQPFHVDPMAARDSVFGGLCASGWHTASVWMKLNLEQKIRREEERAAKGLPNSGIWPVTGVPQFALAQACFCRRDHYLPLDHNRVEAHARTAWLVNLDGIRRSPQ